MQDVGGWGEAGVPFSYGKSLAQVCFIDCSDPAASCCLLILPESACKAVEVSLLLVKLEQSRAIWGWGRSQGPAVRTQCIEGPGLLGWTVEQSRGGGTVLVS